MKKLFKNKKVICILLILFVTAFLWPKNYLFNKELVVTEYQNRNTNYSETIKLHIYGTYKNKIIGNDEFHGGIKIDKYPLSLENSFSTIFKNGRADITYVRYDENGKISDQYFVGYLFCDPKFKDFVILYNSDLMDPNLNRDDGYGWYSGDSKFLTSTTGNRNDALSLVKKFVEKSEINGVLFE